MARVIRPVVAADLPEVERELTTHWGGVRIWSLGRMHRADELPGFVAEVDGRFAGLVTYTIDGGAWQGEVITLSSRAEDGGVGTALLAAATEAIRAAGCRRAYLTTTNDNTRAIGFYQRRGWRLASLRLGAVDAARERSPGIPLRGLNGIDIHDEIEFERPLA
ncbi:MAG: GNAT family N-acetyltransferase [Phycisphaerales bacterium]